MAELLVEASPGRGAAPLDASGIAALLHWWKLAGVDTPTADDPRPWLALEPGTVPRPARPVEPPAAFPFDPVWDPIDSLDALAAKVRAEQPRAPFADGNAASGLMILGEAPSAEDLETGRPFSGPAGRFLDRMLAAIGLDRSGCYIALLCPRKPTPGAPGPDAIAADMPLTRAHIRLMAPRHILLLGANPVQALTGERRAITELRGTWLSVDAGAGPVPALATFNPAYLLRRPEEKAHAWADLLALKHRLAG